MFKEFSNNKDDDYLSEFRQKIASEREAQMQTRKQELERSRNGFIGTIAGIILAALVSWFLLMPRFAHDENTEIPVIRRPVNPVKIQPNDPGGMEILNQDKSVYALVEKHQVDTIKVESILPTPETPKLPEIVPEKKAEEKPVEKNIEQENVDPKANNILTVKNIDELIEEVETSSLQQINIPQKPKDIKLEVKTVEAPKQEETQEVKVQENKAPAKEIAKAEIKETPAKQAETVPAAKTAQIGNWQVQLMASPNIESVKKAWINLSAKHAVLKNTSYEIETAQVNNGATVYRLKAGNFEAKEDADKLCQNLKSAGEGCIVKQK